MGWDIAEAETDGAFTNAADAASADALGSDRRTEAGVPAMPQRRED